MRKKIIAANWKMNMTQSEAADFVSTFMIEIGESTEVEIVIVPPFTAIAAVNAALGQAQQVK
ncbi:MAG: triose-phosphate isomerase, partial [Verrucomicrobiota bacterium]|nr:triose-phosphate isomerase [Verrucomicrobiota bacterium]